MQSHARKTRIRGLNAARWIVHCEMEHLSTGEEQAQAAGRAVQSIVKAATGAAAAATVQPWLQTYQTARPLWVYSAPAHLLCSH